MILGDYNIVVDRILIIFVILGIVNNYIIYNNDYLKDKNNQEK